MEKYTLFGFSGSVKELLYEIQVAIDYAGDELA